jgi:hypothetical protein
MQYATSSLAFLLIAASLAWSGGSHAAIVTYEFTGTETSSGQKLQGTFTLDTAAAGVFTTSALFQFDFGSSTNLTAPIEQIVISNGESALGDPDNLTIGGLAPAIITPFFQGSALFLEFSDPTGTAFTTDLFSAPLPPVSAFATATFLRREFIASIEIEHNVGTIDSLRLLTDGGPVTVAEPQTWPLAAFAAAALAFFARRGRFA